MDIGWNFDRGGHLLFVYAAKSLLAEKLFIKLYILAQKNPIGTSLISNVSLLPTRMKRPSAWSGNTFFKESNEQYFKKNSNFYDNYLHHGWNHQTLFIKKVLA